MKKLLTICTTLLCFLGMVGCGDDVNGTSGTNSKPTITITAGDTTTNSFSFTVTSSEAGELGYAVVANGEQNPTIDELFIRNNTDINGSKTITIEELNDNSEYTLIAVLRASKNGTLSDLKKLSFTTLDDGKNDPITINKIGYTDVTFTINISGKILFQCIDKGTLTYYGITPEEYFTQGGIPIPANGPITVDWIDGESYGIIEMRMREGDDYYIIAAAGDSSNNILGPIYYKEFKTLKRATSSASVETILKDITSTSVTIQTTPNANVVDYYIYVRDKSWTDGILGAYNENTLISTVKKASWHLNSANEATWSGLSPDTEYYCHVVISDNKGAESLSLIEFTTESKQISAPEINLSFIEPSENAHNNLNLQVYSELAVSGKYVIRPTADIVARRAELNYTDEQLINNYGKDFTAEEIAKIASTGCIIEANDLWPEVEYTAIVGIKNAESTLTVKATTHTTPKQPAAPRVESELFTSLLGEWVMTYSLVQENGVKANNVSDVVTIAQGVDDKTNADYRDQNQLVILGFPFNVNAQGEYNKLPVYTPADLLESLPNYYKNGHNLIYRDYGAKIFLQIGEGDVITMPTSKAMYLYNWDSVGYLNFYGCDYENEWTAPATFPVTLSADGNTLTIGAYQAGEEFGYGTYRPSVFLNDYQLKACATSDIVLTRKQ